MEKQLDLLSPTTEIGGLSVRRSTRARRMSIRVDPLGTVEVVVPKRTAVPAVRSFVEENRDWIDRARDHMTGGRSPDLGPPRTVHLKAIGACRDVLYREPHESRVRLVDDGVRIVLSGRTNKRAEVFGALLTWLKGEARQVLPPWLDELSEQHGLRHKRVQIRAQRSRWGSCSQRGTISLNCMLMLLDAELVRYLLVHELCHLSHMNHSRRFWKLVEACEPGYRQLDRRLSAAWSGLPGWALVRV